jgi:hypothetical protein
VRNRAEPVTPVRIVDVATTRDFRRFVDFPFRLYAREHPQWVPPLRASVLDALDTKNNPFYANADRALFLVVRGDDVVGRIAAVENRAHNAFHEDKVGFWGFFECRNDPDAASALFAAAGQWLAARGLETMRGPMNPSTNYECGLLVDGFENRPTFMTAWNPPYYDALCTGAGFSKAKDLLGLWFGVDAPSFEIPPFLVRQTERALSRGRVTFRDVQPSKFDREVAICWDIYNNAWERNWGFIPMSETEFRHMAKDMRFLVSGGLSFIASIDGAPAGFMFAVPDYNEPLSRNPNGSLFPLGLLRMLWFKPRARRYRVLALGVKSAFRSRSLLAVFTSEIMRRGVQIRAEGAEASWLLEDNTLIVKPMRAAGAVDRMRWRIYEGAIRG